MSQNTAASVLASLNQRRAALAEKRAAAATPKDPSETGTVGTGAAAAKAPVDTSNAPANGGPAKAEPPAGALPQSGETPKKPTVDGTADERAAEVTSKAAQLKDKVAAVSGLLRKLENPAATPAAAPAAPQAKSAAGNTPVHLDEATFHKLAFIGALALEDEKASALVHEKLAAVEGVRVGAELMRDVAVERELFMHKLASEEQAYAQALEEREMLAKEAAALDAELSRLPEEKRASTIERMTKLASMHEHALGAIAHPVLQQAYIKGAAEMAAMMEGPQGAEQDPTAGGLPGGSAPFSPEEAAGLIQQLVAEGLISPEELEAIIAQYAGAGGEGGEGAEPADPEAAKAEEAAEAEAKEAAAILEKAASL